MAYSLDRYVVVVRRQLRDGPLTYRELYDRIQAVCVSHGVPGCTSRAGIYAALRELACVRVPAFGSPTIRWALPGTWEPASSHGA